MSSYPLSSENRLNWEFFYTVQQLLAGAKSQLAFREERQAFWTGVYNDTKNKIESGGGITITESASRQQGWATDKLSAYTGRSLVPSVQIDPTLEAQLLEADSKILHHKQKVDEYRAWVEVFETAAKTHPESTKLLKMADWLYFFRGTAPQ